MRAVERYGLDTYSLDTQVLWYELGAVAPESLQEDMQSARGMVDFFISLAVLAGVYTATAAGLALWRLDWRYGLGAVIGLLLARAAYLRAVRHVLELGKAQQAIVNVSRGKLADVYGLALPIPIDDEREMWSALTAFVRSGDAKDAKALEVWRKPPSTGNGGHRPGVPREGTFPPGHDRRT
jgi:hypothetical protein